MLRERGRVEVERGEVTDLADHAPLHWFGSPGQDGEPGERGLSCCDPWRHRPAKAVTEEEDPLWVDAPVLTEQLDSCESLWHVLVGDGEARSRLDLGGVGEGHLVEAEHCNSAGSEAPRQVLERLVAADRLVAVQDSGPGEQDDGGMDAGRVGEAHRAGDGKGPGAERDVVLIECRGIGVGRGLPRRGWLGCVRGCELDTCKHPGPGHRDHHRQGAVLARHRHLHDDDSRSGRLADRLAQRGYRASPLEL